MGKMIQLDDSDEQELSVDKSGVAEVYVSTIERMWRYANISSISGDNEFRMEEEMARLVAEKENVEAEKKGLARQLERLQNAFVFLSGPSFREKRS